MPSLIEKAYCRLFQKCFWLAIRFMPWREPELLSGAGSMSQLPARLKSKNISDCLLITDKFMSQTDEFYLLQKILETAGIKFTIFDKAIPNPTIDCIEEAALYYKQNNCKALIAFGGGSVIDCAKGVGIKIARPKTAISKMRGTLKVLRSIPYLVAIPTTAGTGSEATVAAVITDSKTHEKYPVNDFVLIPKLAVLDANITLKLPPHLTATTGMDAFTHAIESFIGGSNFGKTEQAAIEAGKLIIENLPKAYNNGNDISARENLQKAAYLAGFAFTRAYVGYVHAIAHSLGGMYHVPHGLANAVILPIVLEHYGKHAEKRLAEFARKIGAVPPSKNDSETSKDFIKFIQQMNKSMGIPEHLDCIQPKDIPALAKSASKEGNPLYPVPVIYNAKEIEILYTLISGK